jgi:Fur family zinc uptake transcriptional regulator
MRKPSKRTPAEVQDRMIAAALREAGRPVSAYELIDHLREEAVLAPQTVYRALARLVEDGTAHRLESLNAFVACQHPGHGDDTAVFAICETCGVVQEFDRDEAIGALKAWAEKARFEIRRMTLEMRGECARCAGRRDART